MSDEAPQQVVGHAPGVHRRQPARVWCNTSWCTFQVAVPGGNAQVVARLGTQETDAETCARSFGLIIGGGLLAEERVEAFLPGRLET